VWTDTENGHTAGTLTWKQTINGAIGFLAAPILADSKLLIGAMDGKFYALYPTTGAVLWSYDAGSPLWQTAAYNAGRVYFTGTDMKMRAVNTSSGSLAWTSSVMGGLSAREYWPVVSGGRILVQTARLLASNGVPGIHLHVLSEADGSIDDSYPQALGATNSGAYSPPCILPDGRAVVAMEMAFTSPWSGTSTGWGLLNLSTKALTSTASGTFLLGNGNADENMIVSCSQNLVFAMHWMESNAQSTAFYNLGTGAWTNMTLGQTNKQMSSNNQSGGNPMSVSNGYLYHIVWNELVARRAQ
jgi:outer membrane protein assembly factor BamB